MRISDWSSDVCSSDLVAIILVNRLQKPVIKAIDYALAARHDTTLAVHVAVDEADADRLQKEWEEHHLPGIGRAACRERVCQYVYVSVADVSSKIKKPTQHNVYK